MINTLNENLDTIELVEVWYFIVYPNKYKGNSMVGSN